MVSGDEQATPEALTEKEPGAPPSHPKRLPSGDVQTFIAWWLWGYEQFRGHPYKLERPKDPTLVARLLQTYPLARLKQMAMFLWHDETDEWIAKTDRGIGILSTKANALADWIAQNERKTRLVCDVAPEPEQEASDAS